MVTPRSRTRYGFCHTGSSYINNSEKTLKKYNNYNQMNMIRNLINKYIHDDEQKLALKISMASFLIFITILISIIGTSYFYGYREMSRDLRTESNMMDINPGMIDMMSNDMSP